MESSFFEAFPTFFSEITTTAFFFKLILPSYPQIAETICHKSITVNTREINKKHYRFQRSPEDFCDFPSEIYCGFELRWKKKERNQ